MSPLTTDEIIQNGNQLYQERQYAECIHFLHQNLKWVTDTVKFSQVYALLGQSYQAIGEDEHAVIVFKKALELESQNENNYFLLGSAYRELNQFQDEIALYQQAIALLPNNINLYLNLGSAYQMMREFSLAIPCYQAMIKLDPQNAMAYRNMGICFKYSSVDHEHKQKIIDLLCYPKINREDAMQCHFALAKIYQDCQVYQKAFYHYHEGNSIRACMHYFSVREYLLSMDAFISTFNQDFFLKHNFRGSDSQTPVFIIGIPRAGKTLVQHVISRHPLAANKDEVACFEKIIQKSLGVLDVNRFILEIMPHFDEKFAKKMAMDYLSILGRHVGLDSQRIIDTTPTNFRYLGLIHLLFPKAKIIHCTRHPLDHCLSIYFKFFAQGNDFSSNMEKLAQYYLQYKRMMKHWEKLIKLNMLEISYEDLVLHSSKVVRRIFDFIDLPINEALLDVKDQEQNPLFTHEVNDWKNYEPYIEVLKAILKKGDIQV